MVFMLFIGLTVITNGEGWYGPSKLVLSRSKVLNKKITALSAHIIRKKGWINIYKTQESFRQMVQKSQHWTKQLTPSFCVDVWLDFHLGGKIPWLANPLRNYPTSAIWYGDSWWICNILYIYMYIYRDIMVAVYNGTYDHQSYDPMFSVKHMVITPKLR